MRTAIVAGVGALGLVAAVSAWLVLRGAQQTRVVEQQQELPTWFGDATRAPARIAGKVFGADRELTVYLLLDVPDREGRFERQIRTNRVGEFDFGPLRPGPYVVFAASDALFSRLTHVNTLRDAGDCTEIFVYPRPEIAAAVRTWLHAYNGDWSLPYRVAKGEGVRALPQGDAPIAGTVLQHDGTPARGVGVQAFACPTGDHDLARPLDIETTSAMGTFRGYTDLICGYRIWQGASFHETRSSSDPVVIRLPAPGAEVHRVFDRRRDIGDPHGAWIRGRVVRNGQPVADVDIDVYVLPMDNIEVIDEARSRSDGSFEVYVSSPDLDESNNVILRADQAIHGLYGIQVIQLAPGERRDGVTVEIGAGAVVSGVVVDEAGQPVSSVHVEVIGHQHSSQPTGPDGRFRVRVPSQGRWRLHAMVPDKYSTELEPADGLAPKIDIVHPDGETDVRLVVRRGTLREVDNSEVTGYVDLGLVLHVYDVQAVGDELKQAGLRPGDSIIAASRGGRQLDDNLRFLAGEVAWGEDTAITVKRGTSTFVVRATAPTFSSHE
jgi:hypothetical protein